MCVCVCVCILLCVDRNLNTQLKASIFDGSSPDSRYERRFTVVSGFIFIFIVLWEQKHATKKLSEIVIQPGIEPGSPDCMLGTFKPLGYRITYAGNVATSALY